MSSKKIRDKLIKEGYTLMTYNQWKRDGFQVMKGEKSPCRTEYGEALFTDHQVEHISDMSCPACGVDAYTGCSCMYDILS